MDQRPPRRSSSRRRRRAMAVPILLATVTAVAAVIVTLAVPVTVQAASPEVVISEVYGGGGGCGYSSPRIRDVQGAAHTSPLTSQPVSGVRGVVTAKSGTGFWFQDPCPDSDPETSEALFVHTTSAPSVVVGDEVAVTGTVIGSGGRVPPVMMIDDDATGNVETSGTFDAATDGIDFYESLEGMRVQLTNPVAVEEVQDNDGPTNSTVVDAGQTYTKLINAITAAGGPVYDYRQINPVDDADGGEPGGNIRVGLLFRTDIGLSFVPGTPGGPTTAVSVSSSGNRPIRSR